MCSQAKRLAARSASVICISLIVTAAITISFAYTANALNNALLRENDATRSHRSPLKSSSRDNDIVDREKFDRIRRRRQVNLKHWGVERNVERSPVFPCSFDEVADEAFNAIRGTICGAQAIDPNMASNAMHKSVLDYRPTQPRAASRRTWLNGGDDGTTKKMGNDATLRMGIEIDGASHLLPDSNNEGRAMRMLSLELGQLLSELPWDESDKSFHGRSVAIYFNSVKQSLLASDDLGRLKVKDPSDSLDRISILCLGDPLPERMAGGKVQHSQRKKDKAHNVNDATVILIVKPSDYDYDSRSTVENKDQPLIKANVIDNLQALLFQASATNIPAVVLSPRLAELPPLQAMAQTYKRTGPSGFEQSGYQMSSTYGGIEPPVGPTSWLLRDLIPPVYVWVGCAGLWRQQKHSYRSILASVQNKQHALSTDDEVGEHGTSHVGETYITYYSRFALKQSAMDNGHAWHMFAAEEKLKPLHTPVSNARLHHGEVKLERHVSYHYMGSSNAARGRPSSRIMNDVFEEYLE